MYPNDRRERQASGGVRTARDPARARGAGAPVGVASAAW
jgi:hypothetical protein